MHALNLLVPKDATGLKKEARIYAAIELGSKGPRHLRQVNMVWTSLCSQLRQDMKSVKSLTCTLLQTAVLPTFRSPAPSQMCWLPKPHQPVTAPKHLQQGEQLPKPNPRDGEEFT